MIDWDSRRLSALRLRTRIERWWGFDSRRISEPLRTVDPARLARMENALASMPELTREVFMMHRFDDLPYRRIAVHVGIGVDEVEMHMASALKLLGRASRDEHW